MSWSDRTLPLSVPAHPDEWFLSNPLSLVSYACLGPGPNPVDRLVRATSAVGRGRRVAPTAALAPGVRSFARGRGFGASQDSQGWFVRGIPPSRGFVGRGGRPILKEHSERGRRISSGWYPGQKGQLTLVHPAQHQGRGRGTTGGRDEAKGSGVGEPGVNEEWMDQSMDKTIEGGARIHW